MLDVSTTCKSWTYIGW